jgi:hypothetical protein
MNNNIHNNINNNNINNIIIPCYDILENYFKFICYATFDRGLAQAEKVGVRGVGSIKFIRVPGEHSAFIKKNKRNKKNDSKQNEMEDKKKKMET